MIEEAYVSFEVAKMLKEKGFNEICRAAYTGGGKFITHHNYYSQGGGDECVAPTHQMAMKWLREVHNIFIVIEPHMYDYINEKNSSYVTSLWQGDNYYENITSRDYPTYEEAVEASIKYALENLI
jgi:hypothetical protein